MHRHTKLIQKLQGHSQIGQLLEAQPPVSAFQNFIISYQIALKII